MILIESPGPVPPIYIKYINEEGFKVSADISSYLFPMEMGMKIRSTYSLTDVTVPGRQRFGRSAENIAL